jgi:hypothetical protein
VSAPAQSLKPYPGAAPPAAPLLAPQGARVIIGTSAARAPVEPLRPMAHTLFGPRGAVLASPAGPLVVCDTGHHRILIWSEAPRRDSIPADLVIGQDDFTREGRNRESEPGADTLNVPTGAAVENGMLAVADAWNHRVLLWHSLPTRSNQPADVVLGQRDFRSTKANRGVDAPGPETLHWCSGVLLHRGRLYVADTGNRRTLVWDSVPTTCGAPADLVLGQRDFATRDEGAGAAGGAAGMRWPHAIAAREDTIAVVDAGTSRVMGWKRLPRRNGAPCDFVIGQADVASVDANRGYPDPDATTLNLPYGACALAGRLVVADTANSRLVAFPMQEVRTGAAATGLAAQSTFTRKGDNRWGMAARDSLCWPYGINGCGSSAIIADTGNNRVLLWEAA